MKNFKHIKRIIGTIGITSFIMLSAIIGGMEKDSISLIDGAILSTIFVGFFGLSVMLNTAVDRLYTLHKQQRNSINRYFTA